MECNTMYNHLVFSFSLFFGGILGIALLANPIAAMDNGEERAPTLTRRPAQADLRVPTKPMTRGSTERRMSVESSSSSSSTPSMDEADFPPDQHELKETRTQQSGARTKALEDVTLYAHSIYPTEGDSKGLAMVIEELSKLPLASQQALAERGCIPFRDCQTLEQILQFIREMPSLSPQDLE